MRPPTLAVALGLLTLTLGGQAQEPRLNERFAKSPPACQDGTATLELVKEWLARETAYLPGPPAWVIKEPDLDLDGTADLLIEDPRLSGSGGSSTSAFLRTPRGLRFLGDFVGTVRALPSMRGRVIISTASGSGRVNLRLAEIRSDGLYQLASTRLAAGDSGTEEGNSTRTLGSFPWDTSSADVLLQRLSTNRLLVQVRILTDSHTSAGRRQTRPVPVHAMEAWVLLDDGTALVQTPREPSKDSPPIAISNAGSQYSFVNFGFTSSSDARLSAVVVKIEDQFYVFSAR